MQELKCPPWVSRPPRSSRVRPTRPVRWNQASGAALIEALATCFVFIALFFSLVFVGRVYRARGEGSAEVRAAAWSRAVAGCVDGEVSRAPEGGAEDTVAAMPPDLEAAPRGDRARSAETERVVARAGESEALQMGTETGRATARSETGFEGTALGFPRKTVRVELAVQCDERPRDGDVLTVLGFFWEEYGPSL